MSIPNPLSDSVDVTVRCQDDREASVRLHSRYAPDDFGVGFTVEASAGGLHAEVHGIEVWVWDDVWLPDFIEGLAADYGGWTGERVWRTNHLQVRASSHSRGHVALTWDLQPLVSRSDGWRVSLTTWLDAGEQMRCLAADVRDFLPRPSRSL